MSTSHPDAPHGTLRAAWRLIRPFCASEHKWSAAVLLVVALALTVVRTWTLLAFNSWNGSFGDALMHFDVPAALRLAVQFVLIIACFVVLDVGDMVAGSALQIQWRTWQTDRMVSRWLARDSFYRIEREASIDNPDQRITEDVNQLVTLTFQFTVELFGTLLQVVSFSVILWKLSGPLDFHALGYAWSIPGYMFWIAILYAAVTSGVVSLFGRSLGRLTFDQQRAEADFRFMSAAVREHAEQIALYHGSRTEIRRMMTSFAAIRQNFWQIVRFNIAFRPVTTTIQYVSVLFPMIAALPRYFAHAVSFGGMARLSSAFSTVNQSLSWFIQSYTRLQQYRVVVARLDALDRATDINVSDAGIDHALEPRREISIDRLILHTPSGRCLSGELSFRVLPGECWQISGESGTGKSTLIRALAGIWPHGSGSIRMPEAARVLMLSQKNYVPTGTLKAALCYPSDESVFSDVRCRQILNDCRLGLYVDRLHDYDRWGHRMSPGEQQRLAVARALLHEPDFLFMDETTSALDTATETHLYHALLRALGQTAFVTISHRPIDALIDSRRSFHVLHLRNASVSAQHRDPDRRNLRLCPDIRVKADA